MTDRANLMAMLDRAGVNYTSEAGTNIVLSHCTFVFNIDESLKDLLEMGEYEPW